MKEEDSAADTLQRRRTARLGFWGFAAPIALFVAAVYFTVLTTPDGTSRYVPLETGHAAPDFNLKRLGSDSTVQLADFSGNVVLVEFWATWCHACYQRLRELQALHEELSARGFKAVGVTIDLHRDADLAVDFAAQLGLTFEMLHDAERSMHRDYRATGVPAFYLIDSDGKLLAQSRGFPFDRTLIDDALRDLNGEARPTNSATATSILE